MKKFRLFLTILSCIIGLSTFAQVPFTPGNLVVLRVGDGTIPFSFDNTRAVFLDEFTPTGSLVQSVAMPTIESGSNHMFSLDGVTGGPDQVTGTLTLSPNGQWLSATGYGVPPLFSGGGLNVGTTPRVIGLIDHNAAINTSTSLDNTANMGFPYSAITTNGTDIWACFENAAPNLMYTTTGSSTYTQVATVGGDYFRTVGISNGQLYITSSQGRVRSVGTGLPTTGGQALVSIPNGPPIVPIAQLQFCFVDVNPAIPGDDVMYIAHSTLGLQKYSFDGSTWTLNGTIGSDADDYRAITGVVNGTSVKLYCTRKAPGTFESAPNGGGELVTLTDGSGHNGAFSGTPTVIATASFQTIFRGVAFAPQASSVKVAAKIFLQGAYNAGLARHKDVSATWAAILNANALNQPYNTSAFGNYAGTEHVSSGFFASTAATTDVLDWVLLELRDATTPATVVARRAAFIREDGRIVDTDGTSDVSFVGVANGSYNVVIRHRNHLDVRTPTALVLSGTATLYDFTDVQSKAFQDPAITTNPAMKDFGGGVLGMYAGNSNGNTTIRFTGLNNDAGVILSTLSNNQATVLTNQYNSADLNMDGTVRFTGLNNDPGVLLSVLGNNQAAIFTRHQ